MANSKLFIRRLVIPFLLLIPMSLTIIFNWYTPIAELIGLDVSVSIIGSIGLSVAALLAMVIEPVYKKASAGVLIIAGTLLSFTISYLFHLDLMREGFSFSEARLSALFITVPIPIISMAAVLVKLNYKQSPK